MGRDDDRREKRSWREIDRMRDGSGGSPRGPGDRADRPQGLGAGYSKYKADLNRLFDVGRAQGVVAGAMRRAREGAPAGEAGGPDEADAGGAPGRAALVRACRLAEAPAELFAAVDALLATGPLPDDLELLVRIVDHPREAVVAVALDRIGRLAQRKPIQRKASLLQRLYTLEQTAETPALRDAVNRLIEAFR